MAIVAPSNTKYEVVIGIEIHVQLRTHTKLFCSCSTQFGVEQNQNTCPICLAMPGVLPVLNRQAVDYAILAGLALNCRIADVTKFDRKQYFYPDLPKAYQISQYDMPICIDGHLTIDGARIGITRAHLEEDAGKLVHGGASGLAGSTHSLVDLNRAGTPLLEIVSEPDIRSSEQARKYVETIRSIVRYTGVCDGNLEQGSLRVDANVSIRPLGDQKLYNRTEIKNMNSFRAIQRAIDYEVERQIELTEAGQRIVQESRLWNDNTGTTASMRSKEEAHDYRYFPEPDLRPLVISREWVEGIKATMPELPWQRLERLQKECGLSEYDAGVMVEFKELGDFLDATAAITPNYKTITNLLQGDITGYLKNKQITLEETKLTPQNLAEIVALLDANTISSAGVKKILPEVLEDGTSPKVLVEKYSLAQVSDTGALKAFCEQVISENAGQVEAYKGGKQQLFGFFVGQVMKVSKGAANPEVVTEILKELLS